MKKNFIKKKMEIYMNNIRVFYILSIIASIVAIALLVWLGIHFLFLKEEGREFEIYKKVQEKIEEILDCDFQRKLDGVCVESENLINPELVAIMIENHVDSRPQSGLAKASVVYEVPVEANITRFMAFYPLETKVKEAGPVRSARSYFLDWLSEYGDPLFMHVGGSPAALQRIYNEGILTINEMGSGWYFWRDKNRYAPHNTYTSNKLWEKAFEDYWNDDYNIDFEAWKFDEKDQCEENCIENIEINYGSYGYTTTWKFDSKKDRYMRYQSGSKHRDLGGDQIVADSIIIQKVQSKVVDSEGRLNIDTVGNGEAVVFRDGYKIDARWEKLDIESRTKWFDKDGNEVGLKSGKIWIEVVNQNTKVDIGES